ncbi:MAG: hypothetical protein Q3962_07855 [Corynebacterium sp.]|nr:hypothetical protein [Corynebacterium sp.]
MSSSRLSNFLAEFVRNFADALRSLPIGEIRAEQVQDIRQASVTDLPMLLDDYGSQELVDLMLLPAVMRDEDAYASLVAFSSPQIHDACVLSLNPAVLAKLAAAETA